MDNARCPVQYCSSNIVIYRPRFRNHLHPLAQTTSQHFGSWWPEWRSRKGSVKAARTNTRLSNGTPPFTDEAPPVHWFSRSRCPATQVPGTQSRSRNTGRIMWLQSEGRATLSDSPSLPWLPHSCVLGCRAFCSRGTAGVFELFFAHLPALKRCQTFPISLYVFFARASHFDATSYSSSASGATSNPRIESLFLRA